MKVAKIVLSNTIFVLENFGRMGFNSKASFILYAVCTCSGKPEKLSKVYAAYKKYWIIRFFLWKLMTLLTYFFF